MLRRLPLRLTSTTAAVLSLAGCATFTNAGEVADVDGTAISADRYEEFSRVYFERGDAFGTTASSNGRVDAEQTRFLLSAMVRQQLLRNFAELEGVDIDSIRDEFKATVLAPSAIGQADLPEAFIDLVADVDDQLLANSMQQVSAPNIDELESMYAELPSKTGLVCVRQILVATESEADVALDRLLHGADFASLADEISTDALTNDNGGALESPDSACVPLELIVQGADADFASSLLDTRAGVPTEPIESANGWHIFLARPWEEVADSVGALHQPGASGKLLFDGYAANAPVTIDPRYGEWAPLTFTIEELG